MIVLPERPAQATDPKFVQIYDYWSSKAPDGCLPGRQHLDPIDIPALLPGLVLYDVVTEPDGTRFRVRIAGQMIVDILVYEPRDRFVDEMVVPNKGSDVNGAFDAVRNERIAHYWENSLWTAGREYITMQRLALPLASDGEQVDMILAYHVRVETQ